jgi:hypothetical protein
MTQSLIETFCVSKSQKNSVDKLLSLSSGFGVKDRDEGGYYVKNSSRIMGGLTKTMKRVFYPDRPDTIRKRGTSSMGLGSLVHRQLYHMIHCAKKNSCDCKTKTNPKKLNVLVKNALETMKTYDFTPIDAEVPILTEKGDFCTRLDIVGVVGKDTSKPITSFIEIKTGYDKQWKRDGKGSKFSKPLDDVFASSRNINQLQTACCYTILSEEHGFDFDNCYVMYIKKNLKECFLETPAKWWWKNKSIRESMYKRLCGNTRKS